ncbi:MAG TPA: nucleotide sugar dehydrogenase [Streptosporangiaceae bacterium]|nr:nucleotide sugar dehydrogenase [Streptosporangiaceae bacterium]
MRKKIVQREPGGTTMDIDLDRVSEKHFSTAVRGWNRDEVRAYLAEVAAAFVPVLQERDRLRRSDAEHRAELGTVRAEADQLRAEAEGHRSRIARAASQESDILADIGPQVTSILKAAAAAGSQIRESAERQAVAIRRKALDDTSTISRQAQVLVGETAAARQQVIDTADNVSHAQIEVVSAASEARREVLKAITRLAAECQRARSVAHAGAGASPDTLDAIQASLQALGDEIQDTEWPLPAALDPSASLIKLGARSPLSDPASAAALAEALAAAPSLITGPAGRAADGDAPGPSAETTPLQVAVLGAGYVGLTTAACLAQLGHSVVCTDHVAARVERLAQGTSPLFEPGLESLVRRGLAAGRLSFNADNGIAAGAADVVILCLPTPKDGDGRADLAALRDAATEIGPGLRAGTVVVDKSTVPVGACRDVAAWLGRSDVSVVSNPEFLREGSALDDFFHPDRVVIGADDPQAASKVAGLYRSLDTEILTMAPESAELVKYASNGFLATKLSFANEIATLCELAGADVADVIKGMGGDRRIGPHFLEPGPGWGGSCFPKDTEALGWIARDAGLDFAVLRAVIESNQAHEMRMADRIEQLAGGSVKDRTVAVWGLTFKASTDDRRASPSLAIAGHLRDRGATIQAYDPTVRGEVPGIVVCPTPVAACEHASALFVATEWDELGDVSLAEVRQVMDRPAILDGRHVLDPADATGNGFTYAAVGGPTLLPEEPAPGDGLMTSGGPSREHPATDPDAHATEKVLT